MANEMRLIDANALIKQFDGFGWGGECDGEIVLEAVMNAPTVEAAPVVHGQWKHRKNWLRSVCSECSFENDEETRFCPNCGAKMDGG